VFAFTKISSNGAAKGISVNALTGSGSFTVNGSAGLCDSGHVTGSDCTGGTIAGGTTRGAEFVNVNSVTLKDMYFNGTATSAAGSNCNNGIASGTNSGCNAALHLQGVNSATLDHLYVNGTGSGDMGINGLTVGGLTMTTVEVANHTNANRSAMIFENLTGTSSLTGLNFHANQGVHNIMITNDSGTANITFTTPTVKSSPIAGGNADGINVQSYLTANLTLVCTGATFGGPAAADTLAGNSVNFGANSGSTMNATLSGGTSRLTNGIYFNSTGANTTFTYNISGVGTSAPITTHNLGSNAITTGNTNAIGVAGTVNGTVTNNVISSATCGGSCSGIVVQGFGNSTNTFTVTNNTIAGVDSVGIQAVGQGTSNNFTIQGNSLSGPVAGDTSYAIDVSSGTSGCLYSNLGDMSASHTIVANKNTISGAWQGGNNPISLATFGTAVGKIQGFTQTTDAQAATWVSASNGGAGADVFHTGSNAFTGGSSCP
jgi:hypothetical protein